MRVLVNKATDSIIQAQKDPEYGTDGQTIINGLYCLKFPIGVEVSLNENSYVLPIDGKDVFSLAVAKLMSKYPVYRHAYINALVQTDDLDDLNLESGVLTLNDVMYTSRYQTGRSSDGIMPGNTALLPVNTKATPNKPGLIVTNNIRVADYITDCDSNPIGAKHFMIGWSFFKANVSHDVNTEYGALANQNTPAYKYLLEMDQTPSDVSVYMSVNNSDWQQVYNLSPISFCDNITEFKLAFSNLSADKIYLNNFFVLFS